MMLLPVHIAAGLAAIASGFVALYAVKGGALHRRSGIIFVYTMLLMTLSGAAIAAMRIEWGTGVGGVLTAYLVATGLRTTRRQGTAIQWIDIVAMLLVLAVTLTYFSFGIAAIRSVTGKFGKYPAALYFTFGTIALLAWWGDVRLLITRRMDAKRRLARHIWRMSFPAFMASASLFLGQSQVIPKPIRIYPLLTILALLPLAVMFYWLIRVSISRRRRSLDSLGALTARGSA